MEGVACLWRTVESEDDDRLCRTCLLYVLVTFVEHCLHASPCSTGDHYVAHLQRTVRDEHGRDIATSLVE